MWHMKDTSVGCVADTPADGFSFYEDTLYGMEDVQRDLYVDRYDGEGDELVLFARYVNPEGEQIDVDAFRPTYEELEVRLMFDIELPES
jgi:hypothetical protein